jgi:hypothetical protein
MLRVIIEQGLLQLFDQVLKPLDRERIRRLVQESIDREDPAVLRELIKEISFVGPLQRSVESWAEGFRTSDDRDFPEEASPPTPPPQSPAPEAAPGPDDEAEP